MKTMGVYLLAFLSALMVVPEVMPADTTQTPGNVTYDKLKAELETGKTMRGQVVGKRSDAEAKRKTAAEKSKAVVATEQTLKQKQQALFPVTEPLNRATETKSVRDNAATMWEKKVVNPNDPAESLNGSDAERKFWNRADWLLPGLKVRLKNNLTDKAKEYNGLIEMRNQAEDDKRNAESAEALGPRPTTARRQDGAAGGEVKMPDPVEKRDWRKNLKDASDRLQEWENSDGKKNIEVKKIATDIIGKEVDDAWKQANDEYNKPEHQKAKEDLKKAEEDRKKAVQEHKQATEDREKTDQDLQKLTNDYNEFKKKYDRDKETYEKGFGSKSSSAVTGTAPLCDSPQESPESERVATHQTPVTASSYLQKTTD